MRRNKKSVIALALCVGVFFMAVGYSTLMKELKINGTANANSYIWDVRIIGISSGVSVGSAYNIEQPSYTSTSAKFNVSLVNPGDSMTYTVTIKNQGTITAVLNNFTMNTSGTEAIIYEVNGLNIGQTTLAANETAVVTITARYDSGQIAQPTERVKRLKIGLEWLQYNHGTSKAA